MISALSLTSPSLGIDPVGAAKKVQGAVGTSFADTLNQIVSQGVATVRGAETAGVQGISGAATTQDVVEAVTSAERSLQTAIAIRDKLVSAFQEISRMQI